MVTGLAGCKEDKNDDFSHRFAHDPAFRKKYRTQKLLDEMEKASIIAHTTYEASEIDEEFCAQKLVEIWKGKELENKLARFGKDGALAMTPINQDGTCKADSIAFFMASEESKSKSVRPFIEYLIHDGKIHGEITVEEARAAAIQQKKLLATP